MTAAELESIRERFKVFESYGISRPIPAGLPHAQLISDLGSLLAELDRYRAAVQAARASAVAILDGTHKCCP